MNSRLKPATIAATCLACLSLLPLLLLLATNILAAQANDKEQKLPELEIHNTFKPEQCSRRAKSTDVLTLHYKGYLQKKRQLDIGATATTTQDEEVFDSTYERNQPFTFQLGLGQVILGWDKGLVGACVGEKLKLVIPPHLGYGNAKHDQIPPGSTLIFEIELLKIEEGPAPMNVFKHIDVDGDKRLSRKEIADYLRVQLAEASRHGDTGSQSDPDQAQMVDEIFQHEDRDKDGYITHDEFSGPKYDHDEL